MKTYITTSLVFLLGFQLSIAQSNQVFTLEHDGETREYQVHFPPGYEGSMDDFPLIINMHGLGSDREQQVGYSYFNLIADTADIVMVYPQGLPVEFWGAVQNHWNAGFGTGVDDVGFLDKMLDHLLEEFRIDPARVYSTGMSNGGYMSYYLACQMSDRIAAIASVTGSMTPLVYAACNPTRPVPILQIHGTNDMVVPFNGNPTITTVVESWVNRNNCNVMPSLDTLPDRDPTDGTTTIKYTYSDCDDDSEIWYYIVNNGGHTWPGSIPVITLGNTSQDFGASLEIWDFFRDYRHPNPRIITSENNVFHSDIFISPNPAIDLLRIKNAPDMNGKLKCTSITGRAFVLNFNNGLASVEELPKGVYHIFVNDKPLSFVKI